MPITDEQKDEFYNKILAEWERVYLKVVTGELSPDVASSFLNNTRHFVPLEASIIETTGTPSGTISKGAYHISFNFLGESGIILGKTITNMAAFDLPYTGIPWGDVTYNGNFLILVGR